MQNDDNQSMQNCSDEDLVLMYQQGENLALITILKRYINTIDKIIYSNSSLSFSDYDDVKQDALIAFLLAIKTYKINKGAKFSTYSARCISNVVKNWLLKNSTKKSKILSNYLALDDVNVPTNQNLQILDPEQIYINKEKYNFLLEKIDFLLSDFEKNVLFFYLEGKGYQEISQELNYPLKAIDNALQRIRRKLKQLLN